MTRTDRRHALCRSRGGFSTKIHLICDGAGLPLHLVLTGGQIQETQAIEDVLTETDEVLVDSENNSIAWLSAIAADKGYRAQWVDELILILGILPVISSKANEDCDQHGVEFDRKSYRKRNIVERLIGRLNESRRVFSRSKKRLSTSLV